MCARDVRHVAAFALACLCFGAATVAAQSLPTGNFITIGDAKLWYEECGVANSGPGVVLLHDGLVHSITWDAIWAPICAKYHVVRYDRRGYGQSDPAKTPFIPEEDLYKIMRQVHMDRAIVMGNSSGGGLALDFALAHPEMVDGLFLIGPVVHGMASTDYFDERGDKNNAPMDHGDLKATAKNWSEDRFIIGGNDARSRKLLYDALVQNPQNLKVSGTMEIRHSPSTLIRLSEIRVPTLVFVGEDDIADVFAYSGAIEAAVSLSSLEVMKDAGHLIQIQRPAELVTRFNKFVRQVERREFALSDSQLSAFAGRYKLFNDAATIDLKDHHLVLGFSGAPSYLLFAASETKFFMRNDDAEVEFVKDASGKILEMAVHTSDGKVIHCPRLDASTPHRTVDSVLTR